MEVLVYQGEVEKKSCGTLQLTYGLEQSDQIYTLICDTDGDSLVLRKRQGPIAVYEIAVIGEGTFLNFKFNCEDCKQLTILIAFASAVTGFLPLVLLNRSYLLSFNPQMISSDTSDAAIHEDDCTFNWTCFSFSEATSMFAEVFLIAAGLFLQLI